MPQPPAGSQKNANTPVFTGNTGTKTPAQTPAKPPAAPPAQASKARPDHATRFRPGVSGNPKGRPKNALNKSTLDARAVLAANARKLADRAIELALEGKPTAMRLCMERILPAMQDRPVQLNLPTRKTTAHDLLAAHNVLLSSVADGTLTPLEAEAVSKLLEARRRSWESVEMEDRIIQLQDDAQAARKIGPPPANIKCVNNTPIPTREEQDRLDELSEQQEGVEEEDDDSADNAQDQDDQTRKDEKRQ